MTAIGLIAFAFLVNSAEPRSPALIAQAARDQIGKTIRYDPSYQRLDYPGGDVPIEVGVCTDVVVRTLRSSLGLDLQQLVHEDMKGNLAAYPKKWGLKAPDKNVDRRVLNLRTFFRHRGWELPVSDKAQAYQPGDPKPTRWIKAVQTHEHARL